MTEQNYYINHNTFAGRIYASDFDTERPTWAGSIAERITSDKNFDRDCLNDARNRDLRR